MLSGLQSEVDTLFPSLHGFVPGEEELKLGETKARFGRLVKISDYRTEIFDMHSAKDRSAYSRRMLDLSERVQTGTVRILVHDRQVMQRKDGSTGWFGYIEWMEFRRVEDDSAKEP